MAFSRPPTRHFECVRGDDGVFRVPHLEFRFKVDAKAEDVRIFPNQDEAFKGWLRESGWIR